MTGLFWKCENKTPGSHRPRCEGPLTWDDLPVAGVKDPAMIQQVSPHWSLSPLPLVTSPSFCIPSDLLSLVSRLRRDSLFSSSRSLLPPCFERLTVGVSTGSAARRGFKGRPRVAVISLLVSSSVCLNFISPSAYVSGARYGEDGSESVNSVEAVGLFFPSALLLFNQTDVLPD